MSAMLEVVPIHCGAVVLEAEQRTGCHAKPMPDPLAAMTIVDQSMQITPGALSRSSETIRPVIAGNHQSFRLCSF